MNSVQKKIVYLNVVFLLVFLLGASLAIAGMFMISINSNHTIILESIAVPCILGSITFWNVELKYLLKIRAIQINKEEANNVKKI